MEIKYVANQVWNIYKRYGFAEPRFGSSVGCFQPAFELSSDEVLCLAELMAGFFTNMCHWLDLTRALLCWLTILVRMNIWFCFRVPERAWGLAGTRREMFCRSLLRNRRSSFCGPQTTVEWPSWTVASGKLYSADVYTLQLIMRIWCLTCREQAAKTNLSILSHFCS